MDVVKAVQNYIHKIVNATTGIKVLLLDSHTVFPLLFVVADIDSRYIRRNFAVSSLEP